MRKPKPVKYILSYIECERYIGEKYKFHYGTMREFRRRYVAGMCMATDRSVVMFSHDLEGPENEELRTILDAFREEFGFAAQYFVYW